MSPKVNQKEQEEDAVSQKSDVVKQSIFIKYKGIATDRFIERLKSIRAPLQPVISLHKMKSCLLSLESKIEKNLKSPVQDTSVINQFVLTLINALILLQH